MLPGDSTSAPVVMLHRDSTDVVVFRWKLVNISHLKIPKNISGDEDSVGCVLLNDWIVTSVI